jgi:hypothetical protein
LVEEPSLLGHAEVMPMLGDPQPSSHIDGDVAGGIETDVPSKETTESQPEINEEAAAPPAKSAVEIPTAFLRLKEHCDKHGLKSEIDMAEPMEHVEIEIRNGRNVRTVYIADEGDADALSTISLENIVFLGEYAAICSYKDGWIEAAVRPHGIGRTGIARRRIFGFSGTQTNESGEIEIPGTGGVLLRLTEKRGVLSMLDYGAPIYLRIEGIGITEHDKAVNLLEDISNSVFMQIDFRFDTPLAIARDRAALRRSIRRAGRLDEDSQLTYPRFSYDPSPSSLYWYARSATSMPLLQFLAFYQCIEFFFPRYSRQEAISRIKNALKDPTFDPNRDSCIDAILNATLEDRRGSLLEERKQLGATLKHCVDPVALQDFFNDTDERKRYFSTDYKKISDKRIVATDEGTIVEQTAARIYDIRCKVVHTKNADGRENDLMILPFSKEEDLLADDVELARFLAQKVLIASSIPLKV